MARYSFGGQLVDLTVSEDATNGDALIVAPSTAIPLSTTAGGSAVTDFLLWNNATSAYDIAATSIVSDGNGILPRFQGPNNVQVLYASNGGMLRAWDAAVGVGVPTGGTTGQVLAKTSGTDYATGWTNPASGGTATWGSITGQPAVIAAGSTTSAAQTALGMTATGKSVATAADAGAVRTAIAAAADSTAVKTTGAQSIAGQKSFTTGIDVPDETLPASAITDFEGAVDDANQTAQVVHGVVYDEGDPLPSLPATGLWVAIKRSAVVTPIAFTALASSPGSGTDGSTWTITLTRAIASGCYAIAFVDLATTGTSPFLPTTLTGGGMTWTVPNDASANPMSGLTSDNKQGMAMFVGTGTGSGTSLTLNAGGTMQGVAWRVVEVANAAAPVQYAKSNSSVSASPSVSLTGVDPTNAVLGFLGQNTSTDCTVGSGFTELGTLNIAPSAPPAVSAKTEYRLDAVSAVGFTGATAASKRVMAVEIPHA